MKSQNNSNNKLSICVLTQDDEVLSSTRRALAHVYPNATISQITNEKETPNKNINIIIIDTEVIFGTLLEYVLDKNSETPIVLLVKNFADIRLYNHHLTGQRSILVRNDITGTGLIQSVHHLLERHKLHEQLQKASHHLKELSIRDELTHLFNHHYCDDILSSEVKKAIRYKRPLSLIITVIKNFTSINESFGHRGGDTVLSSVADKIRAAVREVDIPARYGDNEFAVILPESDDVAANTVATRIRDAVASIDFAHKGFDVKLKTACGVASLSQETQSKDDLLKIALSALLEAKKNNNDSICTSGDLISSQNGLKENRELIHRLHKQMAAITEDVERNYLQTLLKIFSELPLAKKTLIPHSERVAFLSKRLAEGCKLSEKDVKIAHHVGLLHDAGKIAINPEILIKPSKLSVSEKHLVEQHPAFAIEILGNLMFLPSELDAILHHHERIDGKGYPDGITNNNISIHAKILAITEAWDTMITPQAYRMEPLSPDRALDELKKGAGTQFDAELVEQFTNLITG